MEILNTRCDNLTFPEALAAARELLIGNAKAEVFFLNIHCLYLAQNDAQYRRHLSSASLVLPDGVGLRLLSGMFNQRLKSNCNGTDFSPELMAHASEFGYKVFLLGGREGVAAKAAGKITQRFPNLKIVGTHMGYFRDDAAMIDRINRSGAEILLVAMGTPIQEKWISRNRRRLDPRLCLGVGALFDFWSGRVRRAPTWVRRCSMEWFWRVLVTPVPLWRRYFLDDLPFLVRIALKRYMALAGPPSESASTEA